VRQHEPLDVRLLGDLSDHRRRHMQLSLDYFDTCRRKRNVIDYDAAFVATDTEAEEVLRAAKAFLAFVEQWISSENPYLAKT
jgi:hypothetical protein